MMIGGRDGESWSTATESGRRRRTAEGGSGRRTAAAMADCGKCRQITGRRTAADGGGHWTGITPLTERCRG